MCYDFCRIPLTKPKANNKITLDNYFQFGNLLTAICKNEIIVIPNETPSVYISASVKNKIDKINLPLTYITVHCKSNESDRDWDNCKWNELVNRIINNYPIAIIEVGLNAIIN